MFKKDFLLEIGCEELPSHTQIALSKSLQDQFSKTLTENHLSFNSIKTFATPRRLAVIIEGLQTTQTKQLIERQGPSYHDAYDKNNTPTLIGLGFAKSCGVSMDELVIKETPKGKRLICFTEKPGLETKVILPKLTHSVINTVPITRPMRWGNKTTHFVRPVHWVVMIFGNELIQADILGVSTTQHTIGHRFHYPQTLCINNPANYVNLLSTRGFVIPDFLSRKEKIRQSILSSVSEGQQALIDEVLLDEVTGLVEWPIILVGHFDSSFLSIPKEALITTLKTHQKCFPVIDKQNKLQPLFILVSNIASKDPNLVIRGNERVIRARLTDAKFFYTSDRKQRLSDRLSHLERIVFQDQLGSLGDKTKRLIKLSSYIARQVKADEEVVKRAAKLSKCDLVTGMVSEFPNLQGIMGYYYALEDREENACAIAIRDHYAPKFSGDILPETNEGCCLALADRLDTLMGIIGINQSPTGDKDPFALRRAAQAICRLLIEKSLDISFNELLSYAKKCFSIKLPNNAVMQDTHDFIVTRLKSFYSEKNIAIEIFEAVLACNPPSLLDFDRRIHAVLQFQTLPEASSLAAANKRVNNILKKQPKMHFGPINPSLFEFDAERNLSKQLIEKSKKVEALYEKLDYEKALFALSDLKKPIDDFFDSVMIMVDDEKKKQNRLSLLFSIHQLLSKVANISLLSI